MLHISSRLKFFLPFFVMFFLNLGCFGGLFFCGGEDKGSVLPITAFVTIDNKTHVSSFMFDEKDNKKVLNFGGSGTILKSNFQGSYVVSAAHVCQFSHISAALSLMKIEKTELSISVYNGKQFPAYIKALDIKNDICVLYVPKLKNYYHAYLSYTPPKVGDKVYNIAAPRLLTNPNFALIYEGYYAGLKMEKSWYSSFAVGGSSGSMILNSDGDLIGIVTHAIDGVLCSLGPQYKYFKTFLEKNIP